MPNPGTVNNAQGVNGWEGFGTEEPYGQATQDAALQGAAPLAGGQLAAGAIGAPKKAQRQAQKPQTVAQPQSQAVPNSPSQMSPQQTVAQTWAAIAASPGAEDYPILAEMAEAAQHG